MPYVYQPPDGQWIVANFVARQVAITKKPDIQQIGPDSKEKCITNWRHNRMMMHCEKYILVLKPQHYTRSLPKMPIFSLFPKDQDPKLFEMDLQLSQNDVSIERDLLEINVPQKYIDKHNRRSGRRRASQSTSSVKSLWFAYAFNLLLIQF